MVVAYVFVRESGGSGVAFELHFDIEASVSWRSWKHVCCLSSLSLLMGEEKREGE